MSTTSERERTFAGAVNSRAHAPSGLHGLAIGIDAGGSKVAAGLVELATGVVVRRLEIATPSGGLAVLDACVEVATDLAATDHVERIGLAVPEIVDPHGAIQSAANWDWRTVDVRSAFSSVAPVHVQADVRAGALGEARVGTGVGLDCFVYVTIGTGISAVVVRHGVPWEGRCGAALVLGVPPVEDIASGRALASLAGESSARDVVDSPRHVELVAQAATHLGEELGRVVNMIDPDAVIVGGSLGLNARYRRQWVEVMRRSVWHRPASLVPVVAAELGADAGIVGAALAAASLVGA